jgi:uncharacterized membrane protein required for colicin V production
MLIDLILGVSLIIFTILGLRDGLLRKFVACISLIVGLFLGHIYMHNIGDLLIENTGINPSKAPLYGFLIIFISIMITQGLLYKILTGGYKLKGIADRIGGVVIGFLEGVLFLSSVLFIFALSDIPSLVTARESKLYRPIVNISPQILDYASTLSTDTIEKLNDIKSPRIEETSHDKIIPKSIDSSAFLSRSKQQDVINKARKSVRKHNP